MHFRFEPPGRDRIKFAWGHGRYLDAWSLVHAISGLLLGTALLGFGVPLASGILLAIVAAILYEGFEMVAGIIENLANVVVDIALVVLGLVAAYWLLPGLSGHQLAMAFVAVAALDVFLVYLGWLHHLRDLFRQRKNGRAELAPHDEPP